VTLRRFALGGGELLERILDLVRHRVLAHVVQERRDAEIGERLSIELQVVAHAHRDETHVDRVRVRVLVTVVKTREPEYDRLGVERAIDQRLDDALRVAQLHAALKARRRQQRARTRERGGELLPHGAARRIARAAARVATAPAARGAARLPVAARISARLATRRCPGRGGFVVLVVARIAFPFRPVVTDRIGLLGRSVDHRQHVIRALSEARLQQLGAEVHLGLEEQANEHVQLADLETPERAEARDLSSIEFLDRPAMEANRVRPHRQTNAVQEQIVLDHDEHRFAVLFEHRLERLEQNCELIQEHLVLGVVRLADARRPAEARQQQRAGRTQRIVGGRELPFAPARSLTHWLVLRALASMHALRTASFGERSPACTTAVERSVPIFSNVRAA
jgi:hypothetical protein